MLDIWNDKFDWKKNEFTWYKTQRDYNQDILDTDDIYFRFEKYVSGVCYTYINSLDNIYKTDYLTGDGLSIFNMYNEYELLNKFYKNFKLVDIAINYNIDINIQYQILDNINLYNNLTVLLFNQNNSKENNVYIIKNNKLILSDYLDNIETSKYFKVNIRLGSYAFNEFSLYSENENFPTTYENKYFNITNSYILKHIINYDFNNNNKMMFLNYDLARKQFQEPYKKFNNITINNSIINNNDILLKYKNDDYYIKYNSDYNNFYFNNSINYSNISGITNINNETIIKLPLSCNAFTTSSNNEFINIKVYSTETITGATDWYVLSSYVGEFFVLTGYTINNWIYTANGVSTSTGYTLINGTWSSSGDVIIMDEIYQIKKVIIDSFINIYINEYIPDYIIKDFYKPFYNYASKNFEILNLNYYNNINLLTNNLKKSYYNKFIDFNLENDNIILTAKKNYYDMYFDYDNFYFNTLNTSYKFITDNIYLKYNLTDYLTDILTNTNIVINKDYTINTFLNTGVTNNKLIKITPYFEEEKNYFTEFTFINVNINNDNTIYTGLILEINYYDNYILFEIQENISLNVSISRISNVIKVNDISNLLKNVYENNLFKNSVNYKKHQNYINNKIYNSYAKLISTLDINSIFRLNISGLLYEDEKDNLFVLKLYNVYNIKDNIWGIQGDDSLFYKPVELFKIGIEKMTGLPYIIKDQNIIEQLEDFNFIMNVNNDSNELITGGVDDISGELIIQN